MCVNNTHHTHGTLTHCHLFLPKKTKTRNNFFFFFSKRIFISQCQDDNFNSQHFNTGVFPSLSCVPPFLPAVAAAANAECRERNDKRSFSSMSEQQNNKSESNRQAGVCTSEYWSLDIKQTNIQTNKQTQPFS